MSLRNRLRGAEPLSEEDGGDGIVWRAFIPICA